MKRLSVGGVLTLALLLVAVTAAGAATPGVAGTAQDTASTKAFIALQARYDIGTIRRAPAVNAAMDAVVAQVRSGCADVLKDAPEKPSRHQVTPLIQFLTGTFLDLNIELLAPLHGLSDRIGDQQQRLRFSDPALQWQVRQAGSALVAYVNLRPPDLCGDARALEASHFTKLPAAGTRFAQEATTLLPLAAPSGLLARMRPYAPVAVSAALQRLPKLQRTLDHKLAFGRHYRALIHALGGAHLQRVTNSARAGVSS